MGRKLGRLCPFRGGEAGSPPNTMWPGSRPTCVPSFILIRPIVWPQCTNVTDRQTDRQDRQPTDSIGRPFYKRSPKNLLLSMFSFLVSILYVSTRCPLFLRVSSVVSPRCFSLSPYSNFFSPRTILVAARCIFFKTKDVCG